MKLYNTEFKERFLHDYDKMTIKEITNKYKISSRTLYEMLREFNPNFPVNKFKLRKKRNLKEYKVKKKTDTTTHPTTTICDDDGTTIIETRWKYVIISKTGVNMSEYIDE